jgi:hypothetical protein
MAERIHKVGFMAVLIMLTDKGKMRKLRSKPIFGDAPAYLGECGNYAKQSQPSRVEGRSGPARQANFGMTRLGTLRPRRGDQKMKIAIAQPLKNTGKNACATGAERGVSNRG